MLGFQRSAGAAVWAVLLVCRWLHAQFIEPVVSFFLDTVLGSWEESMKAGVRETCALASRFTNACSAAAVSLFLDRRYYSRLRSKHTRPTAWQAWWQQQQQAGGGTFNAVVERDGLVALGRRSPAPPGLRTPRSGSDAPSRGTPTPTSTLERDGWVRSSSGGGGEDDAAAAPPRRSWLQRWRWPRGRATTRRDEDSATGGAVHGASSAGAAGGGGGPPPGLKRSGSELFDRPSGRACYCLIIYFFKSAAEVLLLLCMEYSGFLAPNSPVCVPAWPPQGTPWRSHRSGGGAFWRIPAWAWSWR